jgi:hypothetical protein
VFDWLFEGRPAVYVALAAAAVVLFVAWWQTRKRYWLYATAAFVALAGLYFLLDRLVETDREQIVRKVNEMAAGVRERNVDRIFANVSEHFRLNNSDRAAFRQFAERALRTGEVTDITVWDFQFPEDFRARVRRTGTTGPPELDGARVSFMVKPQGPRLGAPFFRCDATFVRGPDGQWRLFGFQLFQPGVDSNQPVQIPQLPQ